MKAELWEREYSESGLDIIHGYTHTLQEIYFPTLGICTNLKGVTRDGLVVWRVDRRTLNSLHAPPARLISIFDADDTQIQELYSHLENAERLSVAVRHIIARHDVPESSDHHTA